MPHTEKLISREEIFTGRVIHVTRDTVLLENGEESTREVVHHNGGACIAALNEKDELYFVRQYRHAYEREILELPAGKLEKGEDPFYAAKRELTEEAGITADDYISLGTFLPTCGYCTETIYLYAAKNLHQSSQNLDADEFVTVEKIPFAKVAEMIAAGEINDGKTIAAYYRLAMLRQKGKF
ncbi:MAG: NUDIX hydrolase [Pygmaiobacter massiliensis]|nr:NUDIX hydrolase [Pygmaiobacter massiliensis]